MRQPEGCATVVDNVPATRFESWEQIAALVAQFDSGELPKEQFTHREHLTVAFWYLSTLDETAATERIRAGIIHLNFHHGTPNTDTRGYHETLTRFWIAVVRKFLNEAGSTQPPLDTANQLIERYSDKRLLWREYYSFDLLESVESRRNWIPPDVAAI
jgi:hypothetical protein